jgi:hypothetical protein
MREEDLTAILTGKEIEDDEKESADEEQPEREEDEP